MVVNACLGRYRASVWEHDLLMVRESASLLREDVEVKMRQAGYILTILSVLIQEIEFVCRDWQFDLLS